MLCIAWDNSLHPFQDPYKPVNKRFEDECVFGKVVPYSFQPHLSLIKQQLENDASKSSLQINIDDPRSRRLVDADDFAVPSGPASGRSNGSVKPISPGAVSPKPGEF